MKPPNRNNNLKGNIDMKKIILLSIALLGVILPVKAADSTAQDFITWTNSARNKFVILGDNITTNLPASVYKDCDLTVARDGAWANYKVLASVCGTNATSTNTFTYTFVPVGDAQRVSTVAQNKFTFTLLTAGTTPATIVTNLPSAIFYGCASVRLTTIVSDDSATDTGSATNYVRLIGFSP